MDRSRPLLAAMLVAFALSCASALAQTPGDNGQIDQYTESIPTAEGNEPTGGGSNGGNGGGGDDAPALTPQQSEDLAAQGDDGTGVANLTEATAPADGRGEGSGDGDGQAGGGSSGDTSSGSAASGAGSSSGGLAGAFDAVGGSDDGLGLALPLILAAVAVAGVAIGWRRRAGRAA